MKLSAWAKEQGVSYRAALNWFHAGTLPVPARQLPTGTILVDPPATTTGTVVAYAGSAPTTRGPTWNGRPGGC